MRGYALVVAIAISLGCRSKTESETSRIEISKPTAQSVAARKVIDGEVTALVFAEDAELGDQLVGYLEDLGKQSGKPFAIRELDRMIDVEEARNHHVMRDAVVFIRGERTENVDVRARSARDGGSNGGETVERFDRDVAMTLQKLGRVSPTVQIVLAGDEGRSKYTLVEKLVSTGGFKLVTDKPQVMLVIDRGAGSIDEALAKVDAHVAAGGAALIALEPVEGRTLGPLEKRLGVRFAAQPLTDDKAFVRAAGTAADYRNVATNMFASHPATADASRSAQTVAVFMTTGSLEVDPAAKPAPIVIVRSGPSAFVDTDANGRFDPGEKRHDFPIAAAVELAPTTPGKGRVLVYADADWISDAVLPQVPSHQLLAFNALRWLGVQSELDLPPLPAAKALADVELTRYPLRDHAKTATTARPAASGLWDEPADAVESIVLTTKDGVVTLTRDGRDLKGRDDRIHAGSASVREYPVDEQSAHELLAAIAKPASPRALGKVDDARRRELGLDGSETLVVKAKATHELVLGGQVYGSSGRYALDRATGEAYVLEVRPLVTMSTGEAALRLRNLVPFDLADIARVVVVVHGAKLDLPVGDAVSAPPGTREALGALVARDLRALRPIEFVTDAQAGSLTQVAGVTVTAKAGATAELEILRDGSSALYVRSRRGLVRVPTTAEHLVHTIEQAIATPP